MKEKILELSDLFFDEIVSIRRYMHMHPELSFQEFETSNYIKSILKSWDINFLDGYANTGILVNLEGKEPSSRVIALRADFDALPILEENDVEYKSKNEGIMHACGHDAHTASMLGALKYFTTKDHWGALSSLFFSLQKKDSWRSKTDD